MKTLITVSLILIMAVCSGCNESPENVIYENEAITLRLYTIDSCEYIGKLNGSYSDILTHKGNCKNHKP